MNKWVHPLFSFTFTPSAPLQFNLIVHSHHCAVTVRRDFCLYQMQAQKVADTSCNKWHKHWSETKPGSAVQSPLLYTLYWNITSFFNSFMVCSYLLSLERSKDRSVMMIIFSWIDAAEFILNAIEQDSSTQGHGRSMGRWPITAICGGGNLLDSFRSPFLSVLQRQRTWIINCAKNLKQF